MWNARDWDGSIVQTRMCDACLFINTRIVLNIWIKIKLNILGDIFMLRFTPT